MTLSPNQFRQTAEVGYLDLQTGLNNVLTCVHLADETTPLVPGQAVKGVDNFTAIPSVEASSIAEVAFGVAVRNLKDDNYPAEARLEVAREGTVIFMEASAAIARFAEVQYDPTTNKVATQASTNATLGIALDKAGADTDIIRVIIKPSSNA